MLDIKFIRDNLLSVKEAAKNKNIKIDLDELLDLDNKRKTLIQEADALRQKKNEASKKIPQLQGDEKTALLAEMKKVSDKQEKLDAKFKKITTQIDLIMLDAPMVPSSDTPIGADDSANVEIKKVGDIPQFDFPMKDHVQLGKELDILDIERGVKIGGSRSYILKGDGARYEAALIKYAADFISRKNYTLMQVPVIVDEFALRGTGYFPGNEEQTYTIEKDHKYLVGTSEVSIGAYHADEVLDLKSLPRKYSGISPCFRREAGTYGKDTSGLYRVHQFNKIEQFIICENKDETSDAMFKELLNNVEEFLQSLQLPYRVLNVCTGDMGKGKYYMNDVECWMPSRDKYGETHSCSNLHDFQARRLNLRYKDADGKVKFCHTLNNTLVATPRILIALWEINQTAEGEIMIPEILRPYMDNQEKITKK
jgi:seryl-tRNA synthetase